MISTLRPEPPGFEAVIPPCPICGVELNLGESFFECIDCEAYWYEHNGHLGGHWNDPAAEQCPELVRPWLDTKKHPTQRDVEFRCMRSADHKAEQHAHPQWHGNWGPDVRGAE